MKVARSYFQKETTTRTITQKYTHRVIDKVRHVTELGSIYSVEISIASIEVQIKEVSAAFRIISLPSPLCLFRGYHLSYIFRNKSPCLNGFSSPHPPASVIAGAKDHQAKSATLLDHTIDAITRGVTAAFRIALEDGSAYGDLNKRVEKLSQQTKKLYSYLK